VQVHIAEQASLPGVGATHGTGVDFRKCCAIVASSGSDRQRVFHHPVNDMAQRFNTAIIVVTHDEKIIPTFKRIYHIRDGVTQEEPGEGRQAYSNP
ncbi:MAG: hypothetical protein Q7T36_03500, partial [Fluviicoccus sp.]|nr:hypothetical protein [Fluviicoccus sp.]